MTAAEEQSTSTRAVKDTARLFGARMAAGVVSVFFTAWLLRLVPVEDLAIWPIALALAAAVEGLSSLGMGDTFVRRVPRYLAEGHKDRAGALLRTGLLLNVVVAGLVTAVFVWKPEWVAENILRDPSKAGLVGSLGFVVFFTAIHKRMLFGLSSTQQFGHIALLKFFTQVAPTPLGVLLYINFGLTGLLAAFAAVPALAAAATLIWLMPYLRAGSGLRPIADLLQFSAPFYGVSLLGFLRGRAHYLVVGMIAGPEILSVYFVASKVSDYLREVDRFGISAITPKLAERGGLDDDARPRIMSKCMRYMLLAILPLHLGVAALAGPITRLYAGSEYAEAATILVILAICGFVQLIYDIHRAQIKVYAPPVHTLALAAVSSVIDLGAIVLLVWIWGALGAAIAKLGASVVLSFVAASILSRTMRLRYDAQALRTAGAAGVLMTAVCIIVAQVLQQPSLAVLGGVVLGAATYMVALRGRVSSDDLLLLRGALPDRIWRLRSADAIWRRMETWLVLERSEASPSTEGGAK